MNAKVIAPLAACSLQAVLDLLYSGLPMRNYRCTKLRINLHLGQLCTFYTSLGLPTANPFLDTGFVTVGDAV